MKNKSLSGYLNLVSAVIGIIVAIYTAIFTTNEGFFSGAVLFFLVASVICEAIYLFTSASIMPVIAVVLYGVGLMTFINTALDSLVGYFTGVAMFGGTNDATSIFVIIGALLIAAVLEVVSSFCKEKK